MNAQNVIQATQEKSSIRKKRELENVLAYISKQLLFICCIYHLNSLSCLIL